MKKTLILVLLTFTITANAQTITTFCGNGTAASSGDAGPATSAGIHGPSGIVFDVSGNTYVTEYYENKIRKINSAGVISTFAGTGAPGFSGDGGAATSATINHPIKLLLDATGNLFVGDYLNNRIRKITPAGVISTFAGTGTAASTGDGGPATSAAIFGPIGLDFDAAGNMYVSDYNSYKVRKITPAGIITTIAGTGSAGFSGDGGLATSAQVFHVWGIKVDGAGNIYLSDASNHRVRKISTSGIITTIAGTGVAGFSGDGGPATAAQLNNPSDVDIDAAGNIYISDQVNNRIRKISTSGIITTVVGNGTATYAGDGGNPLLASINNSNDIAFSPSGVLYIADDENNRVREVVTCTAGSTIPPVNDTVHLGDSAVYTVTTSISSPLYQWQQNAGAGWVNLTNVWPYSHVTTSHLTIHNAAIYLNNTWYRCVITNASGCADTSSGAILVIKSSTGVSMNEQDAVQIFPNPANNVVNIGLPYDTEAKISLYNQLGQQVLAGAITGHSGSLDVQHVSPGIYILKIETSAGTIISKIMKQ